MSKPEKSYTVREGYVVLLDGDHKAAAVLFQMIRWQIWIDNQPDRDGWFYKSSRDLANDLFGMASHRCCKQKLDMIEGLGFLASRETKDPTHPKQWRVKIGALQKALESKGFVLPGYTKEVRGTSVHTTRAISAHVVEPQCTVQREHTKETNKEEREKRAPEPETYTHDDPAPIELPDLWDRNGREPLDHKDRADMMQFQEWYFTWAGEKYPLANNRKRNCALYALRFWTAKEIKAALKRACARADRSLWSFFVSCLEQMAHGQWEWDRKPKTRKSQKQDASAAGQDLISRLKAEGK